MLSAAMNANKSLCIIPSSRKLFHLARAYTGAQAASDTDA
jgi:hypothetical protein